MTLSEQIVYGMVKPSKYKEILELKRSRWIGYVIVMMLALSVFSFAIPVASTIHGFGGFKNLFTNTLSDFEYSNQELNMEKPYKMTIGMVHVLVDTEYDTIPIDILDKDGIYYAIGKKSVKLVYMLGGSVQAENDVDLDLLLTEGFNNQTLCDMIPGIYLFLVLMFITTAVGQFISHGFFSLILALCVNSMNKHMEIGLSFGKVFALSFYGQSLYMVVSTVNNIIGILPSILVTMVGLFVTIHFVTTALISMSKFNHV